MSSLDDSSEQRLAELAHEAVELLKQCRSRGPHRFWMLPRVLAIQREELKVLQKRMGLRSVEELAKRAALGKLG